MCGSPFSGGILSRSSKLSVPYKGHVPYAFLVIWISKEGQSATDRQRSDRPMSNQYKIETFPDDETLKKRALSCPMLAHCPDRTFSFCLKKCAVVNDDELMYRKITFKHCYECQEGIE